MKKLTILAVFALMLGAMVLPSAVFAAAGVADDGTIVETGACTETKDCVTGLKCVSGVCKVVVAGEDGTDTYGLDTLGTEVKLGDQPFQTTVAKLINVALSLLGVIAIVIVLIGGFKWMTAGGNDEKTAEARKWIFSGIIGLAIILSAWAITKFVFQQLYTATGGLDAGAVGTTVTL